MLKSVSGMGGNEGQHEHFFRSREELFTALSERCTGLLQTALGERQQASLLVSGGNTPKPLFQLLSEQPLDWSRICVALVDERWVDENHPSSNAGMVKSLLLRNQAEQARFVGMKQGDGSAKQVCDQINRVYEEIPAPYDLLILGMGSDGHIASLFPYAAGLAAALNPDGESLCCAAEVPRTVITGDYTERMSLTLNGILRARRVILLITGDEKLAVYHKGLSNTRFEQSPVSAVLQQCETPVDIYWAP